MECNACLFLKFINIAVPALERNPDSLRAWESKTKVLPSSLTCKAIAESPTLNSAPVTVFACAIA